MSRPLRLLFLEDSEDDYELVLREIRKAHRDLIAQRVETAGQMRAALAEGPWDGVISDFLIPDFGAMTGLAILQESKLDLPFIIVSGTITDEIAVEALRAGAHDFMLKDRLARLVPALERELREANLRRQQGEAEDHRRKMEEQLLIADRMVSMGMLAAGVAHEINNPLAVIIANLELALGDLASPENAHLVREEIDDALAAAERVRNIVSDLKIFSRGDEQKRGAVDVKRVLESSLRMADNELRHRAKIVRNYGSIPAVSANESRLGQVFLNLIVNAAHAIREGHADRNEIRVETRLESGRVVVEIADTGSGIPPDVMRQIFVPFVTTKPVGVGTGLGLSICHRLVTELGGEIAVETELGKGTVFRIALPPAGKPADPPKLSAVPETRAIRRAKLLVIDEEPIVAKAIDRTLRAEHDIVAVTAQEGVDRIGAGERFDVILCDLMMPVMTGMEFHAEVERIAPEQAAAIIFLTGGAFTVGAREFLASRQAQILEKPFGISELRAVINGRVGLRT